MITRKSWDNPNKYAMLELLKLAGEFPLNSIQLTTATRKKASLEAFSVPMPKAAPPGPSHTANEPQSENGDQGGISGILQLAPVLRSQGNEESPGYIQVGSMRYYRKSSMVEGRQTTDFGHHHRVAPPLFGVIPTIIVANHAWSF